jgi:hypothetical protein
VAKKKFPRNLGSEPLFPGPKYQPVMRRGPIPLDELKRQAQRDAVTLGPDHPKVKALRKEIAEREKSR